jgi:hypothetical protein
MQRRDFLAASALATTAASLHFAAHAQAPGDTGEFYECRTYRAASGAKRGVIYDYLESAAVPTWKRMGLGPVGVFTETGDDATYAVHVLLVYPSLEKFAAARGALERDPEYQKNAVEYLAVAQDDPAFERIDSSLSVAFAGYPHLTPPNERGWFFELRTYESHSEERARKKIEMFNSGEMPIFEKCGFSNVFFGETLVGRDLPHLTYMLAAPDRAANEAAWQRFVDHPDWLAMKDDAQYKDTVSKVSKVYLEPTPYSQI